MSLATFVHHLATDAAFVAQLHQDPRATLADAEHSLDSATQTALLAMFTSDVGWQKYCERRLIGEGSDYCWRDSSGSLALREDVWGRAGIGDRYLEALRTMLPQTDAADVSPTRPSRANLPGLCCQAAGRTHGHAQALTDAWTLLGAGLHLLDGVEDNDAPSVAQSRWGVGPAINVSTGLLSGSLLALEALEDGACDAATARAVRCDLTRTLLEMCSGQHDDLTLLEPSLEQAWQIADAKSGAFYAFACRAGARVAGCDAAAVELWAEWGRKLGLLIQLGNDWGGLWGTGGQRSDLLSGNRWTVPVAYAMRVATPDYRRHIADCLRRAELDRAAEDEARALVSDAGAQLYLMCEAQRLYHEAAELVCRLAPAMLAREALLTLLRGAAPIPAATLDRLEWAGAAQYAGTGDVPGAEYCNLERDEIGHEEAKYSHTAQKAPKPLVAV